MHWDIAIEFILELWTKNKIKLYSNLSHVHIRTNGELRWSKKENERNISGGVVPTR